MKNQQVTYYNWAGRIIKHDLATGVFEYKKGGWRKSRAAGWVMEGAEITPDRAKELIKKYSL